MIGKTLLHYEITGRLGAGGMGEVYRAHDTRLGREVAIKVVPEDFGADAERLARFEREAKVLASLNHPHIAQIYGLEEDQGRRFLVLELVDGQTLAERIGRGVIPVDQTLSIALQIAEGLEAAHERSIVHRDLKPANIMLTPDGQAKVLDFGISKPLPTVAAADQARTRTLTRPPTRDGVLIGTPAYMSPEQVRGQAVDKRSDVWAFGVVLWEMLTGERLFEGETDSDIIAAVLHVGPDWQELPSETPAEVRRLLRRCLNEDPRKRLHDIADARLEIEEVIAQPERFASDEVAQQETTLWTKARAAWPALFAVAAAAAVLAAGAVWKLSERVSPSADGSVRLALNLPSGVMMEEVYKPALAISPDGRWVVFQATEGDTRRLFKRSMDQFDATPIPGTEGGYQYQPFFSPDGRWVGFFADGKLKKVPMSGGPPQVIAEAPNPHGASWGPDETIVFNRVEYEGLCRVASAGGTVELLAEPDAEKGDTWLIWPELLPDGRAVLFTSVWGINADDARIEVFDLESRTRKTLVENASYARYVPTGHLIFGQGNGIHVVPFDAERREVVGPSVPVPEEIFYEFDGGVPHLALSTTGSLAFLPGASSPGRQLVRVDMDGNETPLVEARRGFVYPRFSPDGGRLAVTISEPGDTNIWVLDLSTGTRTKVTHEGGKFFPIWTPDGERVTYLSVRGGSESIDWKRADGHGESESIVTAERPGEGFIPFAWSPDGETLVYQYWSEQEGVPGGGLGDLWIAQRDGNPEPVALIQTRSNEFGAAFSPDGRWLAYMSDESGRHEIYAVPFPEGGERHHISARAGYPPVWSRDGRTVYYQDWALRLVAVPLSATPRFRVEPPRVLFEGSYAGAPFYTNPNYDIAPDGKSFVMVKPDEEWGRATEIRVILNWFEELERLAPPGGTP